MKKNYFLLLLTEVKTYRTAHKKVSRNALKITRGMWDLEQCKVIPDENTANVLFKSTLPRLLYY